MPLNHVLGTRFITDDFANFGSKKFFITILALLLLHRGVQKWSFAKYCPHFSFITLDIPIYSFHFTKSVYFYNTFQDFGQCFFSLAILCPSHAILAIASAYFIGLGSRPYYLRTQRQKWILYTRSVTTLLLAVVPMISVIFRATYVNFDIFMKYDGWAKLVEPGIQVNFVKLLLF